MMRRLNQWIIAAILALSAVVILLASNLPYLPFIDGSTPEEVDRLVTWMEIEPGTQIADLGAGDGTFTIAMARRTGSAGHVYATEIDTGQLAEIREAKSETGLTNITIIKGEESDTNLPDDCCDAILSRHVYHHLSDAEAINADLYRALRPGGRLLVIDFEPGGFMDWVGRAETTDRHGGHGTPKETLLKEVKAAGFEVARGPASWRGRTYAVLFRRPDR